MRHFVRHVKENLLVQFSVVSFAIMVVLAVLLTYILAQQIRANAVADLVEEAVSISRGRLLNRLTPSDLATPMTGERYRVFHAYVQENIVSERTARIKLWSNDGTVIYSNNPAGVGERFPLEGELQAALQGEIESEIEISDKVESEYERHLGTLIEVYVPLVLAEDTAPAGVLEIYQYYEPTRRRIEQLIFWVMVSIGLGLVVLYGSLVSIVWGGWRTIRQQQRRLVTANAELQESNEAAIAATLAKSNFLANMSHEIRTPMNAVIGMTSLLQDTPLNAQQQEYVETIRNSGSGLLVILNDILDFSKIESDKLEVERQVFDLRRCIEDVFDLLALPAMDKGLELAYQIADNTPETIVSDGTRLRQILVNLFSNAIKFTASGEIVLSVESQPLPANRLLLHFVLRDTGIGISPERIDSIFQSFVQEDASITRRYGGTGLGLSISRQLSKLLGGDMWVESELGKGSQFHFTMSIDLVDSPVPGLLPGPDIHVNGLTDSPRPEEEDADKSSPSVIMGKRALLVGSDTMSHRALQHQLRGWQVNLDSVSDGQAALGRLASTPRYDVVILDLQLSEGGGDNLARKISQLRPRLPILVLNLVKGNLGGPVALVTNPNNDAGPISSNITVIGKPVKFTRLYEVLTRLLIKRMEKKIPEEKPISSFDPELGKRRPMNVLVAEDNVVNQKVVLHMLRKLGYDADVCATGTEVLEALQRQPYDLILMDLHMPEMGGLEATRQIRKTDLPFPQPHIVAVTAGAMDEDRVNCLAAGMDDYLSKPIQVDQLVEVLDRQGHAFAT